MWECSYGKEPVDIKLLIMRMIRFIWVVPVAALAGGFLLGGIYYLSKVVFAPVPEYQAVSKYYVDYVLNEEGLENHYFNQTTWDELVKTDAFLDVVLAEVNQADAQLAKEQLQGYVSATLLSDISIVTSTVTTPGAEQAVVISKALEQAFLHFGETQKEIVGLRILTSPDEAVPVKADVRTWRAFILGMTLAAAAALAGMVLVFAADDSIYIPETFEKRYGIPMLGTVRAKDFYENSIYLLKDSVCPVIVPVDSKMSAETVAEAVKNVWQQKQDKGLEGLLKIQAVPGIEEEPENIRRLREADAVIIVVKAAAHNGKQVERTISQLQKHNCKVKAAILWDADETFIKLYYGPGYYRDRNSV